VPGEVAAQRLPAAIAEARAPGAMGVFVPDVRFCQRSRDGAAEKCATRPVQRDRRAPFAHRQAQKNAMAPEPPIDGAAPVE